MSRQVGHHKVVESVWCKHFNSCLGSSREVRTSCREERPIILALLCNCFKDCDPQAKMTGRNYWCRHLIYHLHNGPQDLGKKPSASYDAAGGLTSDYLSSLPGGEITWRVMRHHVFGPGNTNTHYSRKTITNINNADHNVILVRT